MSLFAARNISLVLMLIAFPLISVGTVQGRPLLWGIGLASLTLGALMPPVMRFLPTDEDDDEEDEPHEPTDLGESSRVS